ncbi:hypothetical protein [uncultured Pelagimonas sp.]|uniref:hypothetical protein n=1 Tax=uncultured Pelagimonas sp. TaxID=1618102 RepID=UPI0026249039|nr:hypothetical protein [uncultured Pelagimonas sp.]
MTQKIWPYGLPDLDAVSPVGGKALSFSFDRDGEQATAIMRHVGSRTEIQDISGDGYWYGCPCDGCVDADAKSDGVSDQEEGPQPPDALIEALVDTGFDLSGAREVARGMRISAMLGRTFMGHKLGQGGEPEQPIQTYWVPEISEIDLGGVITLPVRIVERDGKGGDTGRWSEAEVSGTTADQLLEAAASAAEAMAAMS